MNLLLLIGFVLVVGLVFLAVILVLRALNRLINPLHRLIADESERIVEIIQPLRQLPDVVGNLRRETAAGLPMLSQEQAELEILSRQVDMLSKQGLVNEERRCLEAKQKQLVKDQQEIRERYRKIQADLDAEARQRVCALERHAFEVLEGDFSEKIQRAYADRVYPVWQMLRLRNSDVSLARASSLNNTSEETRTAIERFLQRYEEFYKELQEFVADHSVEQVMAFEIPIWLVEVETEEEGIRREVVVPGRVEMEGDQLRGLPEAGLTSLQKQLERRVEELFEAVPWTPMQERLRAEVIATLQSQIADLIPEKASVDVWEWVLESLWTTGTGMGDKSRER